MKLFKRSSQPRKSVSNAESTCIICEAVIKVENATKWKNVWVCNNCYDSHGIKIDNNCLRLSSNEILIQVVYTSGLCHIPTAVLERIEKSSGFSPLVKRMNYSAISRSLAYLRIQPTFKKRITKWNYGGNKEIFDDFDNGYTAELSLEYSDLSFRNILVKALRSHEFGCLVSQYGALGHKNMDHPTDSEAVELSKSIQEIVNQVKLEYPEPDWAINVDPI